MFYQVYLTDLNISNGCYSKVLVEETSKERITTLLSESAFLHKYQRVLIKQMRAIKTGAAAPEIFSEELNDYNFTDKEFPSFYYLADDNPYKKTYPVFNVVINYLTQKGTSDYQNQFLFIRTKSGYKLIEVALNVGKE